MHCGPLADRHRLINNDPDAVDHYQRIRMARQVGGADTRTCVLDPLTECARPSNCAIGAYQAIEIE